MDIINSAKNVSIIPSPTDTQPVFLKKQMITVDQKKKCSQEAIRRRCRKRNVV